MQTALTTELYILALAFFLQVFQLMLYGVVANLQVGVGYSMSARDTAKSLTGVAGRLQRALNNHFEALILFAIAVGLVTALGASNAATEICAHAYLVARILYVPAYAQGLTPWRSIIWAIGFFATIAMVVIAVF